MINFTPEPRIKTRTPYDVKHMLLRQANSISNKYYSDPGKLVVPGSTCMQLLHMTFYLVERKARTNEILANVLSQVCTPFGEFND